MKVAIIFSASLLLLVGCGQDRPSTAAEKAAAREWVNCMNHDSWKGMEQSYKKAILMKRMCGDQPKYGMDY